MIAYLIDVAPILEVVGGYVHSNHTVELDRVEVGAEVFTCTDAVSVDVTVSNAGEGIVAYGTASVPVTAECARCLCVFELTLEGEIEAFFIRPGDLMPEDEDAGTVAPDNTVDLGPAIMAALVIDAPFAPLHDPECAGLCPTCGADLNTEPCDCHNRKGSGPFAALEGFSAEESDGE